jgi:hypothetical protein
MKLSRKDYLTLKHAADVADAQCLVEERKSNVSPQGAAPLIGVILALLLLFGLGISLVSSDRERAHLDQIAFNESPSTFEPTKGETPRKSDALHIRRAIHDKPI